ncbi:MAG TPA: hypothetical protein VNS33_02315 [Bradyrhizobium sp.]|nr:hypothetical protein [Bradyrhizobium sp.]
MATLEHLCEAGVLIKHQVQAEDGETLQRVLLFTPDFEDWLVNDLPAFPCDRGRDLSPYDQAEQIAYEFVVGKRLIFGQDHRKLDPLTRHIWELKTTDVRLFGWFPLRAHFIAVCAAMKKDLIPSSKYSPYIQRVIAFRDGLDLDEPKSLTGTSSAEVL